MLQELEGICPNCETKGRVAERCPFERCKRLGYHAIPVQHFEAIRESREAPARLIGRMRGEYLIIAALGEGGMGGVYLAMQMPIGMMVALKVLHRSVAASATLVERFQGEAAALARLNHPNIVRLLKYGVEDGSPYLVMDFVEGGRTLKSAMRAGLDRPASLHILRQMAAALASAHRLQIVHRDIKPDNVMLESHPEDDHFVRVVDFGLAKFTEQAQHTRLLAGTPAYMAPEQYRLTDIGPWTDLFALGAIAFRMLTGKRLYPNLSSDEMNRLKMNLQYHPLDAFDISGWPAETVSFFRRALAHDFRQRFQDAMSFRHALEGATAELNSASIAIIDHDESSGASARMPLNRLQAPPAGKKQGARHTLFAGEDELAATMGLPVTVGVPAAAGLPATMGIPTPERIDNPAMRADDAARSRAPLVQDQLQLSDVQPSRGRAALYLAIAVLIVAGVGAGVWFGSRAGPQEAGKANSSPPVALVKRQVGAPGSSREATGQGIPGSVQPGSVQSGTADPPKPAPETAASMAPASVKMDPVVLATSLVHAGKLPEAVEVLGRALEGADNVDALRERILRANALTKAVESEALLRWFPRPRKPKAAKRKRKSHKRLSASRAVAQPVSRRPMSASSGPVSKPENPVAKPKVEKNDEMGRW